jgi:hydroxymethylglutaryl-CoA synthase
MAANAVLRLPELKHACLGGVYATKAAARYLAGDGRGRLAIVVSSDIAEYQRGSSGEQTQGAGAVAFLLEAEPKLLALDLAHAGSASRYRGYDFRKPFARHFAPGYPRSTERVRDYPVFNPNSAASRPTRSRGRPCGPFGFRPPLTLRFNGKYSTTCYLDEVIAALDCMFAGLELERREFYAELAALFFHLPYHHLPITALATALSFDIARDPGARPRLVALAAEAGVEVDAVIAEVGALNDEAFADVGIEYYRYLDSAARC